MFERVIAGVDHQKVRYDSKEDDVKFICVESGVDVNLCLLLLSLVL